MTWTPAAGEGLAWPVTTRSGRALRHQGQVSAAHFTSASAETVDAVHLYLDRVVAGARIRLDVWETADLPQTVTTDVFRPNEDVVITNMEDEGGATTSLYQSIDEATLDTDDYIKQQTGGTPTDYDFRVASGAATTPFVHAVRVKAVVYMGSGTTNDITLGLVVSGNLHARDAHTVHIDDGVVTLTEEWLTNPETGDRWTQTEVQAFDTTDEISLQLANLSGALRIAQAWLEVDHSPADVLATATATVDTDGWHEFTLDAAWSKANTTDYSFVVRKENTQGQAVWPLLDSGEACPHVSWASSRPVLGTTGFVDSVGDTDTAAHPIILEVSAASSSDSQPYADLTREQVYAGRTVEQEFTSGAGLTAGWLSAVVARHPETTADLSVQLRDRSPDTLLDTWTLTAAEVAPSPRKLTRRDGNLAATQTVDTTQHVVRLTSTAEQGAPWEVAVLDSMSAPLSADADGFGGTTDAATSGGVEDTGTDAPVTVAAVPAAVTGFTATAAAGEVDLAWTATALGGSFSHYLIKRNGEALATIATEATASFTDTGAKQGVLETWSIQVVDSAGVSSLPSEDTATATALSATYRLSSLHDPTVDLDVDAEADRGISYTFAEDRAEREAMGRFGTQVHRSTTSRGDAWSVSIDLHNATDDDRDLFDALLAVRDADVPYITVTSFAGRRWYAAVIVDGGSVTGVADNARATVRFVEVAQRPTVVEVD